MKSKSINLMALLLTIIIVCSLLLIGRTVIKDFNKNNVADDVQEFVSNITTSSGGTDKNSITTPEVLQSSGEEITRSDEDINYSKSNVDKYYYDQLNDYEKIFYNALNSNKENMKSGTYEINMGTEFNNVLNQDDGVKTLGEYYQSAVEAYTYDNPDVFYIDFQKLYLNTETTTRGLRKTYKVVINSGNEANYLSSEFSTGDVENGINQIEKIKSYFVQNKGENAYQNVKKVHDYLVDSISYDRSTSGVGTYSIYGAFVEKSCVCEGYAKAFKYLMDELDVPCVIVCGTGTNSQNQTESHAWNYVQLNGKWYAMDCTWDDPILEGGAVLTNSIKYKYFLRGSKFMNQNHFPDGRFTEEGKMFNYPDLNGEDF